ncbi:MAG: chromate transporter [Chloroflexi bacterium]|nr:chromate transporter [Chloroflexota bacterium]
MRSDLSPPPSLRQFLGLLLLIAATAFGGGMGAHYYHHFVERRQWLTREQFLQDMTLAQLLPGPNMVNIVAIIGQRFYGPLGAALATLAVLLPGTLLLVLLASALLAARDLPLVQHVLSAIAAGAVGLLVATAIRLAPGARGARYNVVVVLIVFALLVLLRWPLVLVVLLVGPLSVWLNRPGAA